MPNADVVRILVEHMPDLRLFILPQIPKRFAHAFDVEDLLQEFAQKMLETRGSQGFEGINNIRAFLQWALSTSLLDKIREIKAKKRGGGKVAVHLFDRESITDVLAQMPVGGKSPSSESALDEAESHVHAAMLKLPKDQRQAVELCRINGLTCEEAGKRMGRTGPAIRGLVNRGMRSLRAELRSPARFLSDVPTDVD